MTWNPRFEAYARAHGRSVEDQLAHDRHEFRGGPMAGFIIWLDEQWRAWFKEVEHARVRDQYAPLRTSDHVAFDAWLEETIP